MTYSIVVAYLAGLVAVLSPCVLPLVPILLVSAWQQHYLAPLGLMAGLSTTFTLVGLALASSGIVLGVDIYTLRTIMAWMLPIIGLILVSDRLQHWIIELFSPITHHVQTMTHAMEIEGVGGQFLLGLALGIAWIPCTGPTLSLASTLASQGDHFGQAALIMMSYSLGVSTPLIGLSYLTRGLMTKRYRWQKVGRIGKKVLGISLIVVGCLILTGYEKSLEAFLMRHMPSWLMQATSR